MIASGATLAIHPGALGDVLLAVPALRFLRGRRPERPLVLAAQPRLGRLLAALGELDAAVDFESLGLGALFTADPGPARERLERAGAAVCWFASGEARFVANLTGILPGARVAPPAADDIPVWQHLRRTVGAALDGDTAAIRAAPTIAAAGRHALREAGGDGARSVLLVHPGAGGAAKRWPVVGFAAALARLREATAPLAIAVHQGPADAEAAEALMAVLGPRAILLREPPLEALAGVLAAAALYLGNDSGVSHLAAAMGAPSVVLFGRARLGWRPWGATARVCLVGEGDPTEADIEGVAAAGRAALA
jgi:ADP-heptose:LPS heptosyltransferase